MIIEFPYHAHEVCCVIKSAVTLLSYLPDFKYKLFTEIHENSVSRIFGAIQYVKLVKALILFIPYLAVFKSQLNICGFTPPPVPFTHIFMSACDI